MKNKDIISLAEKTIQIESSAILDLQQHLTEDFARAVQTILKAKGRVVITGIGKSANIANKVVATLNSTGTPAIFMHAADAIHGDLGNIQRNDVVICISNSGNTPEIKVLIPYIKQMGNEIIAFTGNKKSFLARNANHVLFTGVKEEACPINLAPTSSTTAQLVMGDALAVCLLQLNGFQKEDFAKYHPGGSLGKRLYLTVADVSKNNEAPKVDQTASLKEVIVEISTKRLGATAVVYKEQLVGVITDGDLRRMLESNQDLSHIQAAKIMTKNPKTVESSQLAVKALEVMEKHNITQLLITKEGKYSGVIHLHDLIKEGIM